MPRNQCAISAQTSVGRGHTHTLAPLANLYRQAAEGYTSVSRPVRWYPGTSMGWRVVGEVARGAPYAPLIDSAFARRLLLRPPLAGPDEVCVAPGRKLQPVVPRLSPRCGCEARGCIRLVISGSGFLALKRHPTGFRLLLPSNNGSRAIVCVLVIPTVLLTSSEEGLWRHTRYSGSVVTVWRAPALDAV